jgi:hypothetical protein
MPYEAISSGGGVFLCLCGVVIIRARHRRHEMLYEVHATYRGNPMASNFFSEEKHDA